VAVLVRLLLERMQAPGWLALFALSNRLHLYAVRVVINDTPALAAALAGIVAIVYRRYGSLSE
jgi:hypothetical protein